MSGGEEKKEAERREWTQPPGKGTRACLQAGKGANLSFHPPQGAHGPGRGRQAGSRLRETRPPLLGGRAGTCLDPSEPMGKM